MNLFSQIVPRLTRRQSQAEPASADAEYALKPAFEVQESPEAWGLTVHLPGVTKDGLELTAEEGLLTIRGRRGWQQPAGWTALYRESADAPFALMLEHDNAVNVDQIHAELKDGVLRVSLPKAEALKPRKISVN
jgi:HSP20 family molecular chaperone IbpA